MPREATMSKASFDPIRDAFARLTPALGAVVGLSLFANLLAFVGPLYSLQVYDRVLTSRNETTLVMLSVIAAALYLAYAMLEHYRSHVLVQAGVRLDRMLSGATFQASLKAALRGRGPHQVQALRDVDTLREAVSGGLLMTLLDLPWVPVYLAACFMFHPLIGLVSLGGAIALAVITLLNERLTKRPLVDSSLAGIRALDRLSGFLRNAEAVHGLGMAPAARRQWSEAHDACVEGAVTAGERGGSLLAASKFLRMLLQAAVMGVGAWLVIRQEMSAGVMFATTLVMGRALAPVESAVAQWKTLVSARTAISRLRRTLSTPPEAARVRLPDPDGIVEVENLTVLAPGSTTPVVRGANFTLLPGEVVAVVGPTGSGKSSLARALVGAWEPVAGCVRLDGNDLRHYDPDQLGRSLGYLPQDVELLAGTVRDNVARFRDDADDAETIRAATQAQAHGMIQRLRDGYATQVGEDGVGLSGGQRQRVGLARALYGNPALVVLDEPNANLDGEGDLALAKAVAALREEGRTVVVVTHKQNLLQVADKVMVMHEGVVRAFGPRDEVLAGIMGERHPAREPAANPARRAA